MSCSGLHCAGCSGGASVPVVALGVIFGADWIVTHLVEVIATGAACGALAVAAVVALMRWTEHREARHAVERPLLIARPVYQLPPEPRPRLEASARPAIAPAREIHLHLNVDPDQLAAIMRHHLEEDR